MAHLTAELEGAADDRPAARDDGSDDSGDDHPTAFVSWAHDDPAWEATVYAFVHGLYANGIQAEIDLFHLSDPHINWADYGSRAIEFSDYVLLAVSAAYKQRWDGTGDPAKGAGAAYEANTLKSIFADDRNEFQRKVKVVILPGASEDDIPLPIKAPIPRFHVDPQSNASFEGLGECSPARTPLIALPSRRSQSYHQRLPRSPRRRRLVMTRQSLPPSLPNCVTRLQNSGTDTSARSTLTYGVVLSKVKNARPGNENISELSEPQPTAMSGVYRPTAPEAREALDAMGAALAGSERAVTEPRPVGPQLQPELLRGRIFPNSYAACVDASQKVLVVRAALAAQLPEDPAPTIDSDDEETFLSLVAGSSLEAWAEQTTSAGTGTWRAVDPSDSFVVTLRRPPAPSAVDRWQIECRAFVTVAPDHYGTASGRGNLLFDVLFRPTVEESQPPSLSLQELFELMFMLPAALVDQVGAPLFERLSRGADSTVLSTTTLVQSYGLALGGFVKLEQDGWGRAEGSHDRQGGEWEPTDCPDLLSPERRADSLRVWFKKLLRDSGIRGHDAEIDAMPVPQLPERN